MTDVVLKNIILNWTVRSNDKNQEQLSAENFHACTFMDEVKAEFLKNQEIQHSLWLRYIDDIFLCGLKEKKSSLSSLNTLITFILIRNLQLYC